MIKINPRYFRPTEVDSLLGDPTKAFKKLKWKPKTSLEDLIKEMIESDMKEALKESLLRKKGFSVTSSKESPPS